MAVSQNGWPVIPTYGDSRLVSNPVVPGTGASLDGGILAGDVFTVLMWVARRFHETVEPLIDGQCWGYEPRPIRGSTEWSNHASGTCIDLNSVGHGLGASGTFSSAQVGAIRAILSACGGLVRWGGDYSGRKDEMHFEINGSAVAVAGLAARLGRDPGKPGTPSTPDTKPKEWDEMATEAQIEEIVDRVVRKRLGEFGADPNYSIKDAKTLLAMQTGAGLTVADELAEQRKLLQEVKAIVAAQAPKA